MTTQLPVLTRDRTTWVAYAMLAYYAYMQSVMGPIVPFLRAELGLSYTVAGLHLSAFAVGMIVAGLVTDDIVQRFGRRIVYWGGALGMAGGAGVLALARHPLLTVAGIFVMGLVGSFVMVLVQAILSDRHGARRASALTEANIAAAVASMAAPLAVGAFHGAGLGWRWAPVAAGVVAVALVLRYGRDPVPEADAAGAAHLPTARRGGALPGAFWIYWLVVIVVVAAEWCLIFWGADFLETVVGLPRTSAATLLTVFWVAYVIGRVGGSRLTRYAPAERLLLGAFVIGMVGFPLFWLADHAPLNVVGLFVVGLGFSNLFPLAMSAAVGAAARRSNAASARISLGAGLAILVVPLTLGGFADRVGIFAAYAIVVVLLVVGAALAVGARWAERRAKAPAVPTNR